MPTEILDAIAPLMVIFMIGSFLLIGMKMRLSAKQLQKPEKPEELERLTEALHDLFTQTQQLREEFSELQERMDFHERLLTKGSNEQIDTPA